MNTSSTEIRHLKALVEDRIQHAYLKKHMQKPVIDEEKLTILAAIINNTTLLTKQKERYIITTMLVQVALDTHELVPKGNDPDKSEEVNVSKQLNVLAGDYFSGLYYLLLAEIDDFDLIHNLASAIKEINEYKMKLYYNEANSLQAYVDIVKVIESTLILQVADFVGDISLNSVVGDWLVTSKLIKERNLNSNEFSPLVNGWLNHSTKSTYTSVLNMIDTIIQHNLKQIEHSLLTLPKHHNMLRRHLQLMINMYLYNNTSFVEEG
ncbi:heptaprenyl diphosphate synthase component 1 [Virgibacillus sp. NKC19-16]|uniref:heptaprenyl diphosphate synthase component 1 n=1 Tax=Virgibacillus salidurans TaxID=2831673 RepID=UPI001F298BB0|nr:heptaprenyl diphosphate synthase component 1 [Virgibacillus sp. NKC19-16]UJL48097.1 heptaprenyl diphosphate synthase component 1 [Virgibacillus sp. NKC19-16]